MADGVTGAEVLIIGYGNELRRDDGLGPFVAGALAKRQLPGVRVLVVPQLLPECAAALAKSARAVFIDARPAPVAAPVEVFPIRPAATSSAMSHAATPESLLALADAVCGRAPPAWCITIEGEDFGFGEGLSPAARRNAGTALQRIEALLALPRKATRHFRR